MNLRFIRRQFDVNLRSGIGGGRLFHALSEWS